MDKMKLNSDQISKALGAADSSSGCCCKHIIWTAQRLSPDADRFLGANPSSRTLLVTSANMRDYWGPSVLRFIDSMGLTQYGGLSSSIEPESAAGPGEKE
jgi:hypothetical protein